MNRKQSRERLKKLRYSEKCQEAIRKITLHKRRQERQRKERDAAASGIPVAWVDSVCASVWRDYLGEIDLSLRRYQAMFDVIWYDYLQEIAVTIGEYASRPRTSVDMAW